MARCLSQAGEYSAQGNSRVGAKSGSGVAKDYQKAYDLLTEAISKVPLVGLYVSRADALVRLKRYDEALADADVAVN